jgi:hypothetical protein
MQPRARANLSPFSVDNSVDTNLVAQLFPCFHATSRDCPKIRRNHNPLFFIEIIFNTWQEADMKQEFLTVW